MVHPNTSKKTLEKAKENGGYVAELAEKRLNGEKFPMLEDYLIGYDEDKDEDKFFEYHKKHFKKPTDDKLDELDEFNWDDLFK